MRREALLGVLVAAGIGAAGPAHSQPAPEDPTTVPPVPTAHAAPRTPWGDPDLRATWTSDHFSYAGIDLQRPTEQGSRLWLTDEELTGLFSEIGASVQARALNTPKAGRRRRMLSTVLLPQSPATTPVADEMPAKSGADGESGQGNGGLSSVRLQDATD